MPAAQLARLESLTAALEQADPNDFDAWQPLLASRAELLTNLPPLTQELIPAATALAARGEALLTRLRLSRAGIRSQLQDLHRDRIVLNAYTAPPPE